MSLLSRAGGLHLAYLAIVACGSPPPPALPPPTPPALPAPTEPEVTLFAPGVSPFGRTWSPTPDVVLVRAGAALYTTSDGPVPAWNLTGRLMMPATVEKNGRVEVIPAGFNAACRVEPITSPLAPAMWVRVDDLLPVLTRAATLRWPDNSRIVVHAGFPRDGADWLSVRQVLLGHLPTSAWGPRATSYPARTDADTAGWTGVDVSTWDRTIEVGGVRHELRPVDAALPSVGDAIPPLGGGGLSTLPGADLLRIVGWDGCIVTTGRAQGVSPNGQPDVGFRQFVRGLIGARGSGEVITWGPFT